MRSAVKLLFWLSIVLISYAYFLYPGWLFLRGRLSPRPVRSRPIFPKISVVIAGRNEGKYLEEKLRNLQQLDYPAELLETLVVSAGSTDETNHTLNNLSDPRV